jgi:hypothetical protein
MSLGNGEIPKVTEALESVVPRERDWGEALRRVNIAKIKALSVEQAREPAPQPKEMNRAESLQCSAHAPPTIHNTAWLSRSLSKSTAAHPAFASSTVFVSRSIGFPSMSVPCQLAVGCT